MTVTDAKIFARQLAAGTPVRQLMPIVYEAAGFDPVEFIQNLMETARNATYEFKVNKDETESRPDYKARNDATELLFKLLGGMDVPKGLKSKTVVNITHSEPPLGGSPFEKQGTVIDSTARPA